MSETYESGAKKYKGKLVGGTKVGKHTYWFEDGTKQKEEIYTNRGLLTRMKEWDEDGNLIRDEQPEKGLELLRRKMFKELFWDTDLNGVGIHKLKGNLAITSPITEREGIMVHYATYLENGKEVDSSYRIRVPLNINFRRENSIKGFLAGLKYFDVGDSGYIKVPANMAYGAAGGNGVPPDATIYFQVLVLSSY